jgi:hypothetical protein
MWFQVLLTFKSRNFLSLLTKQHVSGMFNNIATRENVLGKPFSQSYIEELYVISVPESMDFI